MRAERIKSSEISSTLAAKIKEYGLKEVELYEWPASRNIN